MTDTEYLSVLQQSSDPQAQSREENLGELLNVAKDFTQEQPEADPTRTAVALNKYVKEAPFQDPEQSPFMTSIHVLKDDPNFEV